MLQARALYCASLTLNSFRVTTDLNLQVESLLHIKRYDDGGGNQKTTERMIPVNPNAEVQEVTRTAAAAADTAWECQPQRPWRRPRPHEERRADGGDTLTQPGSV